MQIFVDADACPVTRIVEQTARERGIPCSLLDFFKDLQYMQQVLCDSVF